MFWVTCICCLKVTKVIFIFNSIIWVKFVGKNDVHHPVNGFRFRAAILDDDDNYDASEVDDVSSQEEGSASLLTENESAVYNPSHTSASSTGSDQEEGDSFLNDDSSISTKNFNAVIPSSGQCSLAYKAMPSRRKQVPFVRIPN